MEIKDRWINYVQGLQDRICAALEAEDGTARFREDRWQREEGGGGRTRVISDGAVFEKGGVNTSVVFGPVTDAMRTGLKIEGHEWFACGLSLVLHPRNPYVPTVHCNYRMFELYDAGGAVADRWFGGGTDLTPYYLFAEDAAHFHGTYREVCDGFDASFYPRFKAECDRYFVNTHRGGEARGIGGIFYDYRRAEGGQDTEFWMRFGQACGDAFTAAYLPLVQRRKATPWGERERYWQEIRRGRYVEFNLVHDRGTLFGLRTGGRTESILMSLPPTVRFEYDYHPEEGSPEALLEHVVRHPQDWTSRQ